MLGLGHFYKRHELTSLKDEKGFELGLAHLGSAASKISTTLMAIQLASPSPNLFLAKATWGNRVNSQY